MNTGLNKALVKLENKVKELQKKPSLQLTSFPDTNLQIEGRLFDNEYESMTESSLSDDLIFKIDGDKRKLAKLKQQVKDGETLITEKLQNAKKLKKKKLKAKKLKEKKIKRKVLKERN